jgi:exonuclease VII small subunit
MPWETIFAVVVGSGLTTTILVVIGLYAARSIIDGAVESGVARYELTLEQALKAFESALELGAQIDIDLRDRRTRAYKYLWQHTEILPKWPRNPGVTYRDLYEFSETLRDWYFRTGGMYLSRDAQKVYASVQETIWEILKGQQENGQVEDEHYDAIRDRCSSLRTQMTEDILSRKPAPAQPET